MKKTYITLFAVLLAFTLSAQALDGRIIAVTPGADTGAYTPVSVPYDGPAPGGRVEVVNQATDEAAPATIYGGALIFVPASLEAEQEHRFAVRVLDDDAAPRVRLEHDAEAGAVAVYIRDEHFTTYNFGNDLRIPFLWPVHAEGGVTITRNFPMGPDEPVEGRKDHPHHVSLWTAFGDVNGADTWHRAPIRTQSIVVESGDALGVIRAHNVWCDTDGAPQVDEIREYRFYDGPAGVRFIDQTIAFVAAHGEVVFGDNKEGLVAFRIRPEIQGNEAGLLTNAEGMQRERRVYGTPVPWMDYSGPIGGIGNRGIALFSHPGNFRPPCWHVRDYGLFAANPFALSDVCRMDEGGAYTLAEGENLTLLYRYFVHSGDVEEAGVAQRYDDFAVTPKAAWAE